MAKLFFVETSTVSNYTVTSVKNVTKNVKKRNYLRLFRPKNFWNFFKELMKSAQTVNMFFDRH